MAPLSSLPPKTPASCLPPSTFALIAGHHGSSFSTADSVLSVLFLLTHVGALIGDNFVDFDIVAIVVPFASDWKTRQIALGVFALWGLIINGTRSLAIQRFPTKLWRGIHFTSYLRFLLTSFYGTSSGTDATNKMSVATSITATAALVPAVSCRAGTCKAVRARAGSTSVLAPRKRQAAPNISRQTP